MHIDFPDKSNWTKPDMCLVKKSVMGTTDGKNPRLKSIVNECVWL